MVEGVETDAGSRGRKSIKDPTQKTSYHPLHALPEGARHHQFRIVGRQVSPFGLLTKTICQVLGAAAPETSRPHRLLTPPAA